MDLKSFEDIKENKLGLIAITIIITLLISSIFAFLSPYDPNYIEINNRLTSPNIGHIFGTDDMGRDYLTRALYGGRVSLAVGFLSMIISVTIGTLVGTISGYYGGKVDSLIMRGIDILMSIPTFFLILVVNAYLKPGVISVILIIGFLNWMSIARILRTETLSVKEREYVLYGEVCGQSSIKIIFKHIIPNISPIIIVAATINIASAILMESTLSFLGLGVSEPDASWGSMLMDSRRYMEDALYLGLFPGVLILLTVFSFNVIGDILRTKFEAKANNK